MTFPTTGAIVALALALAVAGPARAAGNLIVNGDFEQTSAGASTQVYSPSGVASSNVTGWTNGNRSDNSYPGFNFLVTPGTADTTGATVYNSSAAVRLYGPDVATSATNYSANGLSASSAAGGGGGGNFIMADGDPSVSGTLSQTVTGLTAGTQYLLSFYWAAGQLYDAGNSGSQTTESWNVTFGSQSASTDTITTAFKGFDPWRQATMLFTATGMSQVLSFLAVGGPSGNPPTALLDSVSLVAYVPEPVTWAIMVVGLAAIAAFRWSRGRGNRACPPAASA